MSAAILGCLFGVAQGMTHAVEPDHLAAVSTLVAEERSPRSVVSYAAAWGLGHGLVLVVFGGGLLCLRFELPQRLADVFELVVAVMLVVLGARALAHARSTRRVQQRPHPHTHGGRPARALVVGMVHGLGGSGAVATLVIARLMHPAAGLAFIALYGAGAAAGMSIIAGVAGFPLARFARSPRGATWLLRATGVVSLALGIAWAWPIARRYIGA